MTTAESQLPTTEITEERAGNTTSLKLGKKLKSKKVVRKGPKTRKSKVDASRSKSKVKTTSLGVEIPTPEESVKLAILNNSLHAPELMTHFNPPLLSKVNTVSKIMSELAKGSKIMSELAKGSKSIRPATVPILTQTTPDDKLPSRPSTVKMSKTRKVKKMKRKAATDLNSDITAQPGPEQADPMSSSNRASVKAAMINSAATAAGLEFALTPLVGLPTNNTVASSVIKDMKTKVTKIQERQSANPTFQEIASEFTSATEPGQGNTEGTIVPSKGIKVRKSSKTKKSPHKVKNPKSNLSESLQEFNQNTGDLQHLSHYQGRLEDEVKELINEIEAERKLRVKKEAEERLKIESARNQSLFKSGWESKSLAKFQRLLQTQKQIIQIQLDLCKGFQSSNNNNVNDHDSDLSQNDGNYNFSQFELFAPYASERDGKMVFYCNLCDVSSESELLFRLHLESLSHQHKFMEHKEPDFETPENKGRQSQTLKSTKKPLKPKTKYIKVPEEPSIAQNTSASSGTLESLI